MYITQKATKKRKKKEKNVFPQDVIIQGGAILLTVNPAVSQIFYM